MSGTPQAGGEASARATGLGGALQRTLLWLVLGGWVGAWTLFALVVARAAFQVLPTDLAGQLVGPILTTLHLYGAAAGATLGVLAYTLGRGRLLTALPFGMAAVCLFSHFGVTAAINEVSGGAFYPAGSVEAAARFQQLHGLSMGLFSVVLIAAIALTALHARADSPPAAR